MLRVLTVRQPWASLIVTGHKPVENRPWRTAYRGDVAILAGRAIDTGDRALQAFVGYLGPGMKRQDAELAIAALPRGGVIGLAEISDETRALDSWWFTGPCGLLLRAPRAFATVVPLKGSLCLASVSDVMEATIRAALE